MIGKYFSNGWKNQPVFSNDWKNFSPVFQRLENIFGPFPGNKKNKKDNKTTGGQNRQTIPTIPDNCLRRQLGQPGTTLQGLTQSSPSPPSVRVGSGRRESTRMSRMPLRGLGCLGDGRDVDIENQENRFADRNALGERMGGDNLDNSGQLVEGMSGGQLQPLEFRSWSRRISGKGFSLERGGEGC